MWVSIAKNWGVFVLVFAMLSLAGAQRATAKTDKYNRPSTTTDSDTTGDGATPNLTPSSKKSFGTATASPSPNPDKKVDISDLENRYWTAKDTEFSVVQNRLYTKAKRFSVTLQGGTDLSNT
jgi:hypothetical protein